MKLFPPAIRRARSAFTMVEIAICLAIIGIALVGIIGVLPYGLNTERDTREETIINQDVATLLPIITQGMRGADDLTNYVYAITNYWTLYNPNGTINGNGINGYSYGSLPSITSPIYPNLSPFSSVQITNGANIIGILSTPEFIAVTNNVAPSTPLTTYPAFPGIFNKNGYNVYSNHIIAYVRSMSGSAAEKPPQNNDIVVGDSFTYRVVIVNAPIALDTNTLSSSSALYSAYNKQIWQNQRELRMTYYWPLLPNGNVGNNRQTFRATVAGQLSATNLLINQPLYFYQPQSFGANPTQL
jgi:prepilin-type N-terminal cleavage/methylation domain-containing protein